MTVLTGLLLLGALAIGATLAVLGMIASVAEILPRRATQGEGVRTHAAQSAHPHQNRMPTRMGIKSQ